MPLNHQRIASLRRDRKTTEPALKPTQCLGRCKKRSLFGTLIACQQVAQLSKGHFASYFNKAVKKSSASLISSSEGPWSTTYFLRWLRSLATALCESRSGLGLDQHVCTAILLQVPGVLAVARHCSLRTCDAAMLKSW